MGKAKKILVVEDDNNMLQLITQALVKQNYEVFQVINGDKAIEESLIKHPDLVLLDIMLPGKDGIDICRRIKAQPEISDIKVILLTANTSNTVKKTGLAAGADFYMTKPFKMADLTSKIKEMID